MASISSKLAPKDKQALATLYEGETYNSLLKLINLIKANAAEQALNSPNHENTRWLAGQAYACDRLPEEFKQISEWSKKH